MALVNSKAMLLDAQEKGYAIAAFNVENMEMLKAVVQAAEELSAPVILQTTPSTIKYGDSNTYAALALVEASKASVPICMHLDHGTSYELALKCIEAGYSSVMIDGSPLPFNENVELTKKTIATAHALGISVEAELGKVGGKEDDHEAKADGNTKVDEALEFVTLTGVDSLAIAIGTAHGFYDREPILDYERISDIRAVVDVPLVLHGSSGLKDEEIQECIKRGMCKINFATELRAAYTQAVKDLLNNKPETYDPKDLGRVGMKAVTELAKKRIIICGAANRAGNKV